MIPAKRRFSGVGKEKGISRHVFLSLLRCKHVCSTCPFGSAHGFMSVGLYFNVSLVLVWAFLGFVVYFVVFGLVEP